MDALFFRDRAAQYEMKNIDRELTKAFISFKPHKTRVLTQQNFGIATGHWGCGVFNGDKQLKGTFDCSCRIYDIFSLSLSLFSDNSTNGSF